MGAALAARLGAGFVMCRKPGKLPGETIKKNYAKEYGTDSIEIHLGSIEPDDTVLIHDDLLATGGSMRAAYDLVQFFKPKATFINFLIELRMEGLDGRSVPRWCRETYREVGCYGPLVKRLRRRPLTPQTGVRFPHGSPNFILANSGGRYGNKASKCERISLYSDFPWMRKRKKILKFSLLTFLFTRK